MATAQAQQQLNNQTAITNQQMNMVDQVGPWGSITYQPNGTWADGTARYSQNTTLAPGQQATLDASQAAQTSLAQLAQQQASSLQSSLQQPFSFNDADADSWAWDRASPRILAQQAQNEETLRTRLSNSGIQPGSAAWNSEMARMTNANTDQLNQLALSGRGQAFNEALATRNQPLSEMGALLGYSGVQNPASAYGATPQTGVAGVDYTGLVNQQYQSQLQNYQGALGGLGGIAGTLLGAPSTSVLGGLFGLGR